MKLMAPFHKHKKSTKSSIFSTSPYEKDGVRQVATRMRRQHDWKRVHVEATVPVSFELLLMAGEILSNSAYTKNRKQGEGKEQVVDINLIRPPCTPSRDIQKVLGETLNMVLEDEDDLDWKRVCRPVPPPPRLPRVPPGFGLLRKLAKEMAD
jgi:hypothetical protein